MGSSEDWITFLSYLSFDSKFVALHPAASTNTGNKFTYDLSTIVYHSRSINPGFFLERFLHKIQVFTFFVDLLNGLEYTNPDTSSPSGYAGYLV